MAHIYAWGQFMPGIYKAIDGEATLREKYFF